MICSRSGCLGISSEGVSEVVFEGFLGDVCGGYLRGFLWRCLCGVSFGTFVWLSWVGVFGMFVGGVLALEGDL